MVEKTGYVSAFDLAGELKWKKPYRKEWTKAYPGSRCTPTVDNGFIYIITSLGELVCMDANTGEEKWYFNVFEKFKGGTGRFGLVESLLIDKEKVICTVGGPDATIVAVNKKTGAIVWKTVGLKDKAAYCSPLLIEHGGKRLIVTMTSHHVIGVAADSGKLLWKYPCKNPYGQNPNTPVYTAGMLFCTSGDKIGSFMLKLSGNGKKVKRQWQEPKLDCHHGHVVEINGYLYGSAHQNSDGWVCLELSSGKVMYETKTVAKGSACYADGMLYCYGVDGSVSLVKPSPKGFELISSFKVKAGNGEHFAQPVISGGRLYIRHGDALMVYSISCLSEIEK
jgi:outer membrane protein assembly factor BamB